MEPLFNALHRHHELIAVLDFGSQYSHLIARRLREEGLYSELLPYSVSVEELRALQPRGVILSGGPASVYAEGAPHVQRQLFELPVPILGICYGLQEMAYQLGGSVEAGTKMEFGRAQMRLLPSAQSVHMYRQVWAGVPDAFSVWMSHGDAMTRLPPGFIDLAATDNCPHAVVAYAPNANGTADASTLPPAALRMGLQFHPEVTHTEHGARMLANFCRHLCGCRGDWSMEAYVAEAMQAVQQQVGVSGVVIGAVSGGVDSTVAAVLLSKAIGARFHALFVDNGLLRQDEADEVMQRLSGRLGVNLRCVDASSRFLQALQGVTDPEQKRKVIGRTFIEVFDAEARRVQAQYLLQGTLYPDVIESVSHKGPSATIKTHHNVGGLPAQMQLQLIEPLRYLFKDEVRQLGRVLGVPAESVGRHPFPGPGLAIRILGDVTPHRLAVLRAADAIFLEELRAADLYHCVGQAFAVLLPCKAVGVMGDCRTYEEVIALRAVETTDYMTADWYPIPYAVLKRMANRIVNEVRGVNRVVYDITSKPPATIEWE